MPIIIIESAEALAEQIVKHQDAAHISTRDAILACLHPIEVPSDAGNIVAAVRGSAVPRHDLSSHYFNYTKTEATALITAYSRMVPRAMLDEMWKNGYEHANGKKDIDMADIAAKYGYHTE